MAGWPDNRSSENLVAWGWWSGDERALVVVNLSDASAQGRVRLPWTDLAGVVWRMTDRLAGADYELAGDDIATNGLYVDLPPWGHHFLSGWQSVEGC